jgi:peptide chain release factor 1
MTSISAERIAAIEARRDELQAMLATADLPPERFVAASKEYRRDSNPSQPRRAKCVRLRGEITVLAERNGLQDPEMKAMAARWRTRRR